MKKTLVVLLALVVSLAFFACKKDSGQTDSTQTDSTQQSTEKKTTSGKTYKIGEKGPAGGIVFYDRGFTRDGWRYLEVAPVEKEVTAVWDSRGTNVTKTGKEVGSGKRNTELIVTALQGNESAARLCANLNVNDYKDWFLPSIDELELMYKNLKKKGLGGFRDGFYWSSSQNDSTGNAWAQRFSDGSKANYLNNKGNTYSVRAVRAF